MIKIPFNRAIEILEARLLDLDKPSIDLDALRSRLKDDIAGIFGVRSTQYITAVSLRIPYQKTPEQIEKSTINFKQTINGWIDFIKDFYIIHQDKIESSEQEYKSKYLNLLDEWNELVPDYNKLIKDNEDIIKKYDEALSEIKVLQGKLNHKKNSDKIIKILFLGASPIDEVRLRLDEELRDIESGLKLATLRDQFELKSKWAITTKTLQQSMLDENPNIVHFSGHGDIDGIAVEDIIGNSKLIDTQALGDLFELFSEQTECVVLNSCYSESQAAEIAKHIPYVIGMKSSLDDKAAIAFSVGFYAALGAGKDIPFAYRMGTVSIKLEGISGSDLPILLG